MVMCEDGHSKISGPTSAGSCRGGFPERTTSPTIIQTRHGTRKKGQERRRARRLAPKPRERCSLRKGGPIYCHVRQLFTDRDGVKRCRILVYLFCKRSGDNVEPRKIDETTCRHRSMNQDKNGQDSQGSVLCRANDWSECYEPRWHSKAILCSYIGSWLSERGYHSLPLKALGRTCLVGLDCGDNAKPKKVIFRYP